MPKKRIYTDEELAELGNRIAKIRTELCEESNTTFAKRLGIAKQTASNLCGGSKGAGKKTIDKILDAFPEVNRRWLVFGEGPMLVGDHPTQTNVGNHNSNSGNITTVDDRLIKLIGDAMDALRETNRAITAANDEQTRQISELIKIISNNK